MRAQATQRAHLRVVMEVVFAATITVMILGPLRPLEAKLTTPMVPPWALGIGFVIAQRIRVRIAFDRRTAGVSLIDVPIVIGLFSVRPVAVMASFVVASLVTSALHRSTLDRTVCQLLQGSLSVGSALIVFHALATTGGRIGSRDAVAALAAVIVCVLMRSVLAVGSGIVSGVGPGLEDGSRLMTAGLIGGYASTALGLAGVELIKVNPNLFWVLVIPVASVMYALRAHALERRHQQSIEHLYRSTRPLRTSGEPDEVVRGLLEQARETFDCEIATLLILGAGPDDPAMRSTLGPGEEEEIHHPVVLDPLSGIWTRVAAEQQGVLLTAPIRAPGLRAHFEEQGIRDALAAPLFIDDKVGGVLMVANRRGDAFVPSQTRFFETFANHVSVSMENVRLVRRLKDAVAYQKELGRMRDEFVAAICHELRSPLTSIQGFVKTIIRLDMPQAQLREGLAVVDRQSDRLHRMIEDLLESTRIEAARPTEPAPVDLYEVVSDVVASYEMIGSHRVHAELPTEFPTIETDAESIVRVLANYIDNAVKYSPVGTTITIGGGVIDNGIALTVTDEGPGIEPTTRERIFDRFFQGDDQEVEPGSGVGLGLFICRRMAEGIGGTVSLASTGPKGSTFQLWIPMEVPARRI